MGQYVGIDLHRRGTTLYRMAEDGEVLGIERIVGQPFELAQAMTAAGPEPEVVLESTMAGTGQPRSSRTSEPTSISPTCSATTGATAV